MKIIDKRTKIFVCDVPLNNNGDIESILKFSDIAIDDCGQLYDEINQRYINAYYTDLIIVD